MPLARKGTKIMRKTVNFAGKSPISPPVAKQGLEEVAEEGPRLFRAKTIGPTKASLAANEQAQQFTFMKQARRSTARIDAEIGSASNQTPADEPRGSDEMRLMSRPTG